MVDEGTATAAGAIITSIMANTWITNAPGRRLQDAQKVGLAFTLFPVWRSMPPLSVELA